MNYSPKSMHVWDTWCMPVGDTVHLYHLQRNRPGASVPEGRQDMLGHAVTTNLVDWQELPEAFGPDPANPLDDRQPWTGCALWHEGRGYLYYTMRGSANDCRIQRIGLATSTDGHHWQRHANNPVIVPDPRWYATDQRPVPQIVDCRDLIVVRNPKGGWLGFYATRRPADELPQTSVIACVRSSDLIRWEHLSPAFAPDRYACVEVPDVFEMDGLWYMTCLTGNFYGNRGAYSDPNVTNGTIYAVAERPEGPYREPSDSVLLGSRSTAGHFSARSVPLGGRRYMLYTDRERDNLADNGNATCGTISTPKRLRADGGRLAAMYSPLIESRVTAESIGPKSPPRLVTEPLWGQIWQMPTARWSMEGGLVTGQSHTGWGVAGLGVKAESFILEATVTMQGAVAAGFAFRMSERMSGAVATLEAAGTVAYGDAPMFEYEERRLTPVPAGKPIHLRLVNRREHIEVFVEDELRLAIARYRGIGGEVGLFVDRGRATFADIRLRELRVDQPQ